MSKCSLSIERVRNKNVPGDKIVAFKPSTIWYHHHHHMATTIWPTTCFLKKRESNICQRSRRWLLVFCTKFSMFSLKQSMYGISLEFYWRNKMKNNFIRVDTPAFLLVFFNQKIFADLLLLIRRNESESAFQWLTSVLNFKKYEADKSCLKTKWVLQGCWR